MLRDIFMRWQLHEEKRRKSIIFKLQTNTHTRKRKNGYLKFAKNFALRSSASAQAGQV